MHFGAHRAGGGQSRRRARAVHVEFQACSRPRGLFDRLAAGQSGISPCRSGGFFGAFVSAVTNTPVVWANVMGSRDGAVSNLL